MIGEPRSSTVVQAQPMKGCLGPAIVTMQLGAEQLTGLSPWQDWPYA